MNIRFRLIALLGVATLMTLGCASSGQPKHPGAFSQLGSGAPDALFGTQLPVESAEEAIARGDRAAAMGKSDHALYNYVRALEFDPEDAVTFYKIGMIHVSKGDIPRAHVALGLALEKDAAHAGAQEALGLLLLGQRDYATARRLLEGSVQSDPSRWQAHDALGTLADLREEFAQAREHYEAALGIHPQSAQVHNNLGYSCYLAGDWPEAEAHYRRAVQLDPKFRVAWQNLGQLQVRRGQYEEAVVTFGRVMSKAEAYNNVGYISMVDGKLAVAETWFVRAARTSPSYYETAERNLENVRRMRMNR